MEFLKISWTFFKLTWKGCSTESKQCWVCNWFGRCVPKCSKRMSTFSRHTAKFPHGEISIRRNGFYGKISVRRNICTAKFPSAKFPYGEISLRQDFLTAKIPTAKFSMAKFPTAKFRVTFDDTFNFIFSESIESQLLILFMIYLKY